MTWWLLRLQYVVSRYREMFTVHPPEVATRSLCGRKVRLEYGAGRGIKKWTEWGWDDGAIEAGVKVAPPFLSLQWGKAF